MGRAPASVLRWWCTCTIYGANVSSRGVTPTTPFASSVDAEVAAGVRLVGELLIRDIEAIAQDLVAKILQQEPAYQLGRTITRDELTATVTETATGVFSAIAGAPLERARFEGNGRRRAASSIPLHAVLHAYRIGGLHHWECFARAAASLPLGERIITEGSTTVWSIIDLASQYVTQGYSHEVEELHSRSAEEKAALLQQLLEGSLSADVEVWDAAAVLSLPVAGTFVLVAMPAPRSEGERLPRAERALARHNLRSAWLADTSSHVGLISMGTTAQLGRVVELLAAEAGGAIGMSDPFHEISAASEALRQARIAMAAGLGAVPGVTAYSDVPLQAMLVLAPQSAEQLRQAVLGPLLDAPRGDSAVLMDTLQSWILAGGSATDCANRMYVHRNSVTRRLQRIFELTGCDPRTPRGMGMLYVAAEAHRLTPTSLAAGPKSLAGGIGGLSSPGALRRRRSSV